MNKRSVEVRGDKELSRKALEVGVRKQSIIIIGVSEVIGRVPRGRGLVSQSPKDRRGGERYKDQGKEQLFKVRSELFSYHVTG